MSNTEGHTAKCLNCGRVRHFRSAAAAKAANPNGRICRMKIRLAAINEAVRGFAAAQVDKARELIADGGLIPTRRPGIFQAVSSNGTDTYLVSAKGVCNCPAGLRSGKADRCYHTAAARILDAARAA
jgi:hypothetical protein